MNHKNGSFESGFLEIYYNITRTGKVGI